MTITIVTEKVKNKQFIFFWNKVPGEQRQEERLINYLQSEYKLNYLNNGYKIKKSEDGMDIKIKTPEHIIVLALNNNHTKVKVKADDTELDILVAKEKAGNIRIAGKDFTKERKIISISGVPAIGHLPPGFMRGGAWFIMRYDTILELYLHSNSTPEYVLKVGDEIDEEIFKKMLLIIKAASIRLDAIRARQLEQQEVWIGQEVHVL
jgi:hypothetical protein